MEQGYALISEDQDLGASSKEKLISTLVASAPENLIDDAVQMIAQAIGWRWVGISRFIDDQKVEVLSFYENGKIIKGQDFGLIGTPCEVVVRTKQYAFFAELMDRFPYYNSLIEMGAKTYAGLIYKSNNIPIGHIFAMHDKSTVNEILVEDVFRLTASIVGSLLQVEHAQYIAKNALKDAHNDALTGLSNRRAFDRDVEICIGYLAQKKFTDTLLGIIDLDGMKEVNDTQGHDAGDLLLQTFAKAIVACNRPEDKIYRIGGDEFSLILNGAGFAQIDAITRRIENAVKQTKAAGYPTFDASFGFASLKECDMKASCWTKLADERMYHHKKNKNRQ